MVIAATQVDALRAAGTAGLGLQECRLDWVCCLDRSWLYDNGPIHRIPPLAALSALALGAAYFAEPVDLCPLNIHRERLLGAAAATALSIAPYTGAIMIPGFKKLNKIRDKCALMVTVVAHHTSHSSKIHACRRRRARVGRAPGPIQSPAPCPLSSAEYSLLYRCLRARTPGHSIVELKKALQYAMAYFPI